MLPVIISLPFLIPLSVAALNPHAHPQPYGNISQYAHAHSYSPLYTFHKRDGWETVPVSDLAYKYVRRNITSDAFIPNFPPSRPERRSRAVKKKTQKIQKIQKAAQTSPKGQNNGITNTVKHVVDTALKGIGKIEQVTITWYTGKDLKNPSCWEKDVWTPSDDSFACALTLEGWTNRPKCFQFLELCNGPNKCIFVRVVDTCAGCAEGSKHVDLTKAAFEALATLNQGTLQVSMRLATEPREWHENLWGPRGA